MTHYIDKDALVAEIEKRKIPFKKDIENGNYPTYLCALMDFEDFIDTLEVKEVELEKELKEDWLFADKIEVDCLESMCLTEDMFVSLAKRYFQLGINAQKGE